MKHCIICTCSLWPGRTSDSFGLVLMLRKGRCQVGDLCVYLSSLGIFLVPISCQLPNHPPIIPNLEFISWASFSGSMHTNSQVTKLWPFNIISDKLHWYKFISKDWGHWYIIHLEMGCGVSGPDAAPLSPPLDTDIQLPAIAEPQNLLGEERERAREICTHCYLEDSIACTQWAIASKPLLFSCPLSVITTIVVHRWQTRAWR